jgi:hypothetical protein
MKKYLILSLMLALLLVSCQPNYTVVTITPTPEATEVSILPTDTPPPPTEVPPTEVPPTEVPPTEAPAADQPAAMHQLPAEQGEFFATSGTCAVCHTQTLDSLGNDVSLDSQWRSSMMANSGRDPYWQAGVRNEILTNPEYAGFIEDKCSTCHMPMGRFTEYAHGTEAKVLDETGMTNPDHPLHTLAMDSISCSLCHQFEGENLGTEDSFSGHYEINTELPMGERHAYGPFEVSEVNALVMQAASGFVPTQVDYMRDSEVCGVCHTLYTPTLNKEGEIVGEFAEQMVYPEWQYSSYRETDSCQDCHMPAAEGDVVMSITGGDPRNPFMQHIFVGGNFYMPDLIRRHGDELQNNSSDEQIDATIAQVMDLLQNRTATVSIDNVTRDGTELVADITVTSLVGHKFPTSYPARRTWLHVTVQDADGSVIFESGAFNDDGSIEGNDNDTDATLYEPHYTVIHEADEVQIYEAIMSDVDGLPTTTLLFGSGYLKDNRLLPDGFDKANAPEDFAVWGLAASDDDFTAGADQLRYVIETGEASGPFTITVELLYQSIAYRWAHNLERHDSFETNRFLRYYNETPSPAGLVTQATLEVEF